MPFCPNCRLEYRPQATMCTDCEVALVDALPPLPPLTALPPRQFAHDVVTTVVSRPLAEPEAIMLVAMLEENGIPAIARCLQVPTYNAVLTLGRPWGVIEVRHAQADEARELIAAYLNVPEPETTVEEEERDLGE